MQIIKISKKSFKIVLTRDDLVLSDGDACRHHGFSKEFFTKIIDEANEKYGADFGSGVIDAEFFEDKYGGGELFLRQSNSCGNQRTYAFYAQDIEDIIKLCKRLCPLPFINHSSLYHYQSNYILLLCLYGETDFLLSIINEYGSCARMSGIEVWAIEEHANRIICDNAIKLLAST